MSQVTKEKVVKEVRCFVTSDKMDKSRVAVIERIVKHETYGKYVKQRTKVMFHDAKNETRVGDEVIVTQTRPMSARKKFTLLKIARKAN